MLPYQVDVEVRAAQKFIIAEIANKQGGLSFGFKVVVRLRAGGRARATTLQRRFGLEIKSGHAGGEARRQR